MEDFISGIDWALCTLTGIWKHFTGRDIPALPFKRKPSPFYDTLSNTCGIQNMFCQLNSGLLKICKKILV